MRGDDDSVGHEEGFWFVICTCMCDVLVLIWCCGDGIQWLCEVGPNCVGCHVMEWDEV